MSTDPYVDTIENATKEAALLIATLPDIDKAHHGCIHPARCGWCQLLNVIPAVVKRIESARKKASRHAARGATT